MITLDHYFIVKDKNHGCIIDAVKADIVSEDIVRNELNNFYKRTIFDIEEYSTSQISDYFPTYSYTIKSLVENPNYKRIPRSDTKEFRLSKSQGRYLEECLLEYICDVDIVAGEAHSNVYNEKIKNLILSQLSLFPKIIDDTKKTRMVCGPILMVKDEYKKNRWEGTIIPDLAKHENFILYYSDKRQKKHFRIGGEYFGSVYVEESHETCEDCRVSHVYKNDPRKHEEYLKKFDEIIRSNSVRLSKDAINDFYYLTESELKRLKKIVDDNGLNYNDLNKSQLLEIINKHQIIKQ